MTFRRASKLAMIPWLIFISALVALCLWTGLPKAVGWGEAARRFGLSLLISYPATVLVIIRSAQLIEAANRGRER